MTTTAAARTKLTTLAMKLSDVSAKNFYSPYANLEFPETLEKTQWFTSPELISLHGMDAFERLPEEQRKLLSFHEAVNFYSLNIHGEKALMEGLARRLYASPSDEVSRYLHHFLDEENKHMVYFGTFCTKYAGKIYADRKLVFPREYAEGEEELLFYLKVMIFEEIVDYYNRLMAADERLHEVARKINLYHHRDEIRHLVFGRQMVKVLFEQHAPTWPADTRPRLEEYVVGYLEATWREYYNPDIYQDAGVPGDAYELAEEAFASPVARAHRARVSRDCLDYLRECGILTGEVKV